MKEEIDYEAMSALMLEISDRIRLLEKIFPRDKEFICKHLAGASIHFALFARDMVRDQKGFTSASLDKMERKFLEECGCKEIPK